MVKKISFILCFALNMLRVFGMNSDVAAFTSRTIEGNDINSSTLFYCDIYLKGENQPTINSSTLIGVDFYQLDDEGNRKKCHIHTSHSSLIIGKKPFNGIGAGICLYIIFYSLFHRK